MRICDQGNLSRLAIVSYYWWEDAMLCNEEMLPGLQPHSKMKFLRNERSYMWDEEYWSVDVDMFAKI